MRPYGQGLHDGHCPGAQAGCRDQEVHRDADLFLHTPVCMYPQNLNSGTAVRLPATTGKAFLAAYIRHDHHFITNPEILIVRFNLQNFGCQFVAKDTRITEKSLSPPISMEVCAANPHFFDPEEGLPRMLNRWRFIHDP